jgi:hypothetical protein
VEEVKGDITNVVRARQFDQEVNQKMHLDQEVNQKIHPNVSMPVYGYWTARGIIGFAVQIDAKLLFHRRISEGEAENGFLETHVFVISCPHKP